MESLSSLNILLVEDRERVRKAIQTLLKKIGYSVEVVADGESAIDKLRHRYFDLVISDYKMARMTGIELLRQVVKSWPATEVIIITAFGTISRGVEAIKLGAFDYITKPFDNQELLKIVARVIEKRNSVWKVKKISSELYKHSEFDPIIGKSDKVLDLMSLVSRIATTEKVKRGEFREDLYYRINVIPISVPTFELKYISPITHRM